MKIKLSVHIGLPVHSPWQCTIYTDFFFFSLQEMFSSSQHRNRANSSLNLSTECIVCDLNGDFSCPFQFVRLFRESEKR